MDFKSLGLRTDLIFHRLSAQVRDRGEYVVVRTISQPDYLWGNCILIRSYGAARSLDQWIEIFEREIGPRNETRFMAFAWDDPSGAPENVAPFLDFGFRLLRSSIFTASSVQKPQFYNSDFIVRRLVSDHDWEQYLDVHFSDDWTYGSLEDQRRFTLTRRNDLRALVESGIGARYGAFLGPQLISDLGIYWDRDVARFNNVGTHSSARRQGAGRTLVYEASKAVLRDGRLKTLVVEALTGSPAAKLYEAIGFRPSQQLCRAEWVA